MYLTRSQYGAPSSIFLKEKGRRYPIQARQPFERFGRQIALALALPAAALLGGCQSTGTAAGYAASVSAPSSTGVVGGYASAKLNNINIGMTKDQVKSLMGTPDSTSAQANVEYMVYDLGSDPDNRDRTYIVRLVDGNVESFGRSSQLADLYNRPVTSAVPGQVGFPQPGAGPMNAAPAPVGVVGELRALKSLRGQGVLTDEEFREAKLKVLSQP